MNGLDLYLDTRREFTQKACVTAASNALMCIHSAPALLLTIYTPNPYYIHTIIYMKET